MNSCSIPEVRMQSNMKSRIPKPNPSKIPRPLLSVPKQCAERGKSITITNQPGASIARPIVPIRKPLTSVARTVVPPLKSTAKTKPVATRNPSVLPTKSVLLPSRKMVSIVKKPVVSRRHQTVTMPVATKNPTGISSVTRPEAIRNNLNVIKPGLTKKPLTVQKLVGLAKNHQAHIVKPASSNPLKMVASVANTGTSRVYLQSSSSATTTGKSNKSSITAFSTSNKPCAVNRKAKNDISRKCKEITKVVESALTGRGKALCEEKENIPIVPVKLSLQQNIEFEPSEFCRNLILNNRELSPSIMNRACGFKLPTSKSDRPSAYKRMFGDAGHPNEEAVKAIRNSDFKAEYQRYSKIMQPRGSVTASGTPAIIGRYSAYKSMETNVDPYEEAKRNIMELRSQKAAQDKIPAEFPCKATLNKENEIKSPATRLTEGRYSAYKSMGTIVDPFLEAMKSIMEMRSKKTAQKKVTFATKNMEFPCKVASDVAVREIECPLEPAKEPAVEEKVIFNKQIEDFNTTIEAFNEEKPNSVLELQTKLDKLDNFQKAVSSLKYDLLNKDRKIEKLEEEINRLRNKSENELALVMKEQDGLADNHMDRLTDISEKSEVGSSRSSNCEMLSRTPSTDLNLIFATASSPIAENISCKPNLCPSTAVKPSVDRNAVLAMNHLNADKLDSAVIKSNTEFYSAKVNLELPKSILKNPSKNFSCRYFTPISGLKVVDGIQKPDVFLSPAMRLDFKEHEILENCSPHFDSELIHEKGKPNSINFTETKSDAKSIFVNSSLINSGKSYTHKFRTPITNSCRHPVALRYLKFSDSDIAINHAANCSKIQQLNFKDLEEEDNEDFDPEFENLKSLPLRPVPKDSATSLGQKLLLPFENITQHCTSSDSRTNNSISNNNDQLCYKDYNTLQIGCNETSSQSTYSDISAVLKTKTRSRTQRTQERLFTPQPVSLNPSSRFMSEISPDFLKGRCNSGFATMDCAPIQTPLVLRNMAKKSEQEDDSPCSIRMKICFEEEPQQQTQITGRHISTKLISALPTRQAVFNVLANEEVDFLMKHQPQISLNCRIGNPLASILDEGDEMHFQPIE